MNFKHFVVLFMNLVYFFRGLRLLKLDLVKVFSVNLINFCVLVSKVLKLGFFLILVSFSLLYNLLSLQLS